MQEKSQERSEINAALTLFCIFKRTSLRKDPKYMCVRSTFSCQAQGSRYGNDRVTTDEVCAGLSNRAALSSSASPPPPQKVYFTRDPSIWLEKGKLGNSILYLEKSLPEGSKKFIGRMPGRRRRGRREPCHQKRLELEAVQDLIMADIPAHNQKFLSIMWEKSLCIVSPDAPVKK